MDRIVGSDPNQRTEIFQFLISKDFLGTDNPGHGFLIFLSCKLFINLLGDYATTRFKCCFWDVLIPENLRSWLIINQLQKRFDHAKYGMKPKHSFYGFVFVVKINY